MVYLLCFHKHYRHARHYIGWTDNLEARIARHRKGQGARLIEVITKAGIGFDIARTWPNGDRTFERRLKNRKNAARLCPICKTQAIVTRRQQILDDAASPSEPFKSLTATISLTPETLMEYCFMSNQLTR